MSRKLASFYTPEPVAQVLTDWAITNSTATVLDPSFGGCAFLCAAIETLRKLNNPTPGAQIYGVDVDPQAQAYLDPLYSAGAAKEQFIEADFFDVATDQWLGDTLFDAVVGNPPYIRYHDIPEEMQRKAVDRLQTFEIRISGRASYWAFFLLYSIQFLKPGGRLAMVLPGALLHTDYSEQVRDLLKKYFERVTIFLLEERIFSNTEEESVLVCAEGAHLTHQTLRIGQIPRLSDLVPAFGNPDEVTRILDRENGNDQWLSALVSSDAVHIYNRLSIRPNVIRAGDWVSTRIGVVTGNNKYFILSPSEWEENGLPPDIQTPIVRRAIYFTGLWITDARLQEQPKHFQSKHLLVAIPHSYQLGEAVNAYITKGEKLGVNEATKCRDRKPWFVVPHISSPPAFMPIMSASWPRLVINRSGYTCTNNILKVFWREPRTANQWIRLALGSLSTLSQFSAELVGRSYGGGVLKLEPKEFAKLVIPLLPDDIADRIAPIVDDLLVRGMSSEATRQVDKALIESGLYADSYELEVMRTARDHLFKRRRNHRNDAQRILSDE